MFGAASGTQSLFGGSGAAFGASSSSLFGSSTAGFGGFGQSSAGFGGFGQSSTGFGGFGQSSTGFGGFGQSSSGFGAFGQSSAAFGGFGQSSTGFGSFGQSSAGFGAFGQSSAGFGTFGQSSTAFGFNTQASGSGFGFGQPIGGASSAPGFGLSSTPAFGQTTFGNQPGFFGSSSPASSMFGSTSAFGKQPGGWTMGGVGSVMQGQDQAQHIFSREQQEFLKLLCRKDGRPLTSHTKFRDLQDGGQIALHKIEQELGTCKRLSKDLQSHERLTDRGQFQKEFDAKISSIKQAIGHTKTSATIEWDKLEHLKPTEEWLHAATHDASALCQRGDTWKKGKQEMSTHYSLGYVHKDLSSIAELPNRHLFLCVDELQRVTERLSNWLVDLESSMTPSRENEGKSSQQELEPMMQNMHAYFVHVANKIEKLFGEVDQMKREHLKSLERQGHFGNPFEEAEKERAKREILHKIPLPSQLRSQNLAPTLPMPQNMAHQQSGSQPAFLGGNPPNANPFNAQQGPSFGGTGMFGAQASGMGIGQANTSGLFGQSSGAIGFGGNLIGQSSTAPAVGGSMFGQSSGAFGLGASNSGQSLFGQSSGASLFGQSSGAGGTAPARKHSRSGVGTRRPSGTQ